MSQANERIRYLPGNHRDICKFTENDSNWNTVRTRLEAIAASMKSNVRLDLPIAPNVDPVRADEQDQVQELQLRLDGLRK